MSATLASFKLPSSLEPDSLDVEFYGYKNAIGAGLNRQQLLESQKGILSTLGKENNQNSIADFVLDPKRKGSIPLKGARNDWARSAIETYNHLEDLLKILHQRPQTIVKPSVNPRKVYKESLATLNAGGKDYIRLLCVEPRKASNVLKGRLELFELQRAPPYSALSYSWGYHDQLVRVQVNGGYLDISPDLENALGSVSGRHSHLWVDAICINQSHNGEKNDQVRRMKAIYERAQAVLIWLGQVEGDRPDVQSATDTLDDWCPFGLLEEHRARHLLSRRRATQLLSHGDRAWWSRLWVVQEITSAQRPYVCIGSELITWDDFVKSVTGDNGHGLERSRSDLSEQWQAAKAQIKQLHSLRKHLRSSPGGEEILDLMRITSASQASNPRDKIYGLLGLATRRDQIGIKIDYSYSTARAFGEVVLHVIQNKASLDVLVDQWDRGCGIAFSKETNTLPSWIPDFSKPFKDGPPPLTHVHAYHASGRRRPETRSRKLLELPIQAVRFDVVEEVMSECILDVEQGDELDTFRLVTLPSIAAFTQILHRIIPVDDPRRRIERDQAVWRSLVLDHGADETRPADDEVGEIISILQQTATEEHDAVLAALVPYKRLPWQLIEQVQQTMHGRSLFTTHGGFVGVAPNGVREGDLVVVAIGASVPFVLRKVDGKEKFTLVVDCFIHGIMYGEMMRFSDSGELPLEWFTLT